MAELTSKEDTLTTADLAGTNASRSYPMANPEPAVRENETADGPVLVRNAGGITISNGDGNPQQLPSDRPIRAVSETTGGSDKALLPDTDLTDLRSQWNNIQAGFVDEPRQSVEQADQLVAATMRRVAERFATERAELEKQWDSGNNVSTEELRVALQRYRAFFGRLLNAA